MTAWNASGYVASALVLAAFCMKEMVPLRIVALCSNLAFIAYGMGLGLTPIWLLHAVLLPMNVWRLCELREAASIGPAQAKFRAARSLLSRAPAFARRDLVHVKNELAQPFGTRDRRIRSS